MKARAKSWWSWRRTVGRLVFSERFHCPDHPGIRFLDPTPRLFSFNNPYGSCPECTGFGATLEYDPELIVPNASRTLKDGAVDPWEKPRYKRYRSKLLSFAKEQGVPANVAWKELPKGVSRYRHQGQAQACSRA
jgi:excinuclease ABC subunit A